MFMAISTIRQKVMSYLAYADDNKVKAIYTLLERDIQEEDTPFKLSDEQVQILEMEREMHLNGQSKSYNRKEAIKIIKGQQGF
jgi:hypothetical protein